MSGASRFLTLHSYKKTTLMKILYTFVFKYFLLMCVTFLKLYYQFYIFITNDVYMHMLIYSWLYHARCLCLHKIYVCAVLALH